MSGWFRTGITPLSNPHQRLANSLAGIIGSKLFKRALRLNHLNSLIILAFFTPFIIGLWPNQGGGIASRNSASKTPVTITIEKTVSAEIKAVEYIPPPPEPPRIAPQLPTGSKYDWLRASVIPESEWGNVDFIVTRESGWNPNSTNTSSGAHGLPQALPYSKTGCGWVDAVCQLNWANGYAVGRYGGWYQSVLFWKSHSWW